MVLFLSRAGLLDIMKNRHYLILLILIFFIAFFLRFFKLGEIPFGFYQDESAIGYNAYSIIETGKDEYGKPWPLYFKSFGDYKLPVYIYSTILPIKLFGLNEFAIRFPSAFFGFLTVIIFYFFVKDISKNKNLAIISTALLAINPWHLHYNRATFEVSISLFLFVLGSWLLFKSFSNKKFTGKFLIGTVCFIISLYSYNLTRLLAPLLYFLFLGFYFKDLKNVNRKEIGATVLVSILLLMPFVSTFFAKEGVSSASGTLINSSAAVQSPLLEYRSYMMVFPSLVNKIFFNTYSLTFFQYIKNIINYFSVSFFFVSGSAHGNHGIGDIGQFYFLEFSFILLGLFKLFSQKIKWGVLLLLWASFTVLVAALTRESPQATRSFFLIVPLVIFSGFGLLYFINWIKTLRSRKYFIPLVFVISVFSFYNLFYYFSSYYVKFPISYAKSWRLKDKELSLFIKENGKKYNKIIFDKNAGFMYSSLLFYLPYPPEDFQNTSIREADDSEGFSKVISFGKYVFKDIDWINDIKMEKVLIITTPDKKPNDVPPLKAFYYPRRPVVFAVGQEIMQYPIEEIAFVAVETKN